MLKLMVVDDSNIIRSKICRAHNADKFEIVATATDGAEAIAFFEMHHPQVVTMDLTMPNIDGIECIARLAAINPEVLILVVSALSDQATGIEALEKGASGFLLKPFSENDLRAALDELTEHLND
ncbi:MAG: response regulator [Zhongshania sp.]|uniref:response regulator transcription factor n=1 Tax=Zhongshania sp. TaxID=1971902 RepID=UPI002614CCCD|nr:response regulator [Zhongshania sp.]MDF1692132.1 response regulator [Zhongshania sp.]